jgi:hypothetical protein
VIASGALDAWRFRHVNDAFNRFWTSIAWEAAVAAGPALRLTTDPALARPGEAVRIEAQLQSVRAVQEDISAGAELVCGDGSTSVRLWPGPRPGSFTGTVRGGDSGGCVLSAAVGDETATAPLTFHDDLKRLTAEHDELAAAVGAYGGVVVEAGDEDALVSRLRAQLPPTREQLPTRPMRSVYWLIPFVSCLAGEWWLRRRSGLT